MPKPKPKPRAKAQGDRPEQWARSPKNFVPLATKIGAGDSYLKRSKIEDGRISGWIELTITTEQPLFIRGAGIDPIGGRDDEKPAERTWRQYDERQDPKDKRKRVEAADFAHHGDPERPVIPGSSLRGEIRNLYAIMSSSRIQTAQTDRLLFRSIFGGSAVTGAFQSRITSTTRKGTGKGKKQVIQYPDLMRVHGGFLFTDDDGWWIQPSMVHEPSRSSIGSIPSRAVRLPDGNRRAASQVIKVSVEGVRETERTVRTRNGQERTIYLDVVRCVSRRDGNETDLHICVNAKHYLHGVLAPDWDAKPISVPEDLVGVLKAHSELPRPDEMRPQRTFKRLPKLDRKHQGTPQQLSGLFPIFRFSSDGEEVSSIGTTLFAPQRYRQAPSKLIQYQEDRDGTDPVEALFGCVDSPPGPIASRVYFEDCRLPDGTSVTWAWDAEGDDGYCTTREPLLSPKPQAVQIYLEQPDGAAGDQRLLKTYDDQTKLRGFARYFLRQESVTPFLACDDRRVDKAVRKTHSVMRPVGKGVRFAGRVHFEDLTPEELGGLLTALDLPATKRHSLGSGRPLGMGAVRISVDEIVSIDTELRWSRPFVDDGLVSVDEDQAAQYKRGFQSDGLWATDRMRELAALLEWDHAPPASQTAYVSAIGGDTAQWKNRFPLPQASRVGKGRR